MIGQSIDSHIDCNFSKLTRFIELLISHVLSCHLNVSWFKNIGLPIDMGKA